MTSAFKDACFVVLDDRQDAGDGDGEASPPFARAAGRSDPRAARSRRGRTSGPRRGAAHQPATGPRLDKVVRAHFPGASWNQVRELIGSGKLRIDGATQLDPGFAVRPGQQIEVVMLARRPSKGELSESHLVYVDGDVVVVEKPSGISSVPFEDDDGQKQQAGALNELVRDVLFRSKNPAILRGPKAPLGVVQRLDKETSGLLVFARTTRAKKHLQQQLRMHTVHRRYLALAHGNVTSGTLESRLVQNRGDGRRGSTERSDLGREAVTHVRLIETLEGACLVECRLETGRTHQIRIHLAEAGHPLLGERVYARHFPALLPAARVMLHAAELGFDHPSTGRALSFRSDPPKDFELRLRELRGR